MKTVTILTRADRAMIREAAARGDAERAKWDLQATPFAEAAATADRAACAAGLPQGVYLESHLNRAIAVELQRYFHACLAENWCLAHLTAAFHRVYRATWHRLSREIS